MSITDVFPSRTKEGQARQTDLLRLAEWRNQYEVLTGVRNNLGLSESQIERTLIVWEVIGGNEVCGLDTDEATSHGSRTRYNERRRCVILGADAFPGEAVDPRSSMSMTACLVHELAHAERHLMGFDRPVDLPHKRVDEAEASLHASFNSVIEKRDRCDLVADATARLQEWSAQYCGENET